MVNKARLTKTGSLPEWTVMVYMTSDTDLELYADLDLQEMQKVGSTDDMNVVVQLARRNYPKPARLLIKKSGRKTIDEPLGPKNSGNHLVFRGFLEWVRLNFPAQKYLLILWGHAFGIGFGRVNGNPLSLTELASELKRFAEATPQKARLQLLGCDACSMSKAEAAYQLREAVQFLVGSQTTIPFAGWPYADILNRIATNPAIGPAALGEFIVKAFIASYKPPPVALGLVNLSAANALKDAIEELAKVLLRKLKFRSNVGWMRQAFKDASSGAERALIDLGDLCAQLRLKNTDQDVIDATDEVLTALPNVVPAQLSSPPKKQFNGLGIYAPFVANEFDWERLDIWRENYEVLDLLKDTQWIAVVDALRKSGAGALKK